MSRETPVLKSVLLAVGSRPDARAFRVNSGVGWAGEVTRLKDGSILIRNPRPLRAGLAKIGTADLVLIQKITITQAMVGLPIGRFCALEVKSSTGETSEEQDRFLQMVRDFGGLARVVRSVEDATVALDGDMFGL